MPKLTRVNSDLRYYSVEVTDAQVVEAQKGDKQFEALLKLVGGNMKLANSENGRIEYIIE